MFLTNFALKWEYGDLKPSPSSIINLLRSHFICDFWELTHLNIYEMKKNYGIRS